MQVHMLNGGKTHTALQGQSQARVGCKFACYVRERHARHTRPESVTRGMRGSKPAGSAHARALQVCGRTDYHAAPEDMHAQIRVSGLSPLAVTVLFSFVKKQSTEADHIRARPTGDSFPHKLACARHQRARTHRLCVCLRIVPLHPNRTYDMCGLVASVGKCSVRHVLCVIRDISFQSLERNHWTNAQSERMIVGKAHNGHFWAPADCPECVK